MVSGISRKCGVLLVLALICLEIAHSRAACTSTVNIFPYHEDFETSDGGWVSLGTNNDWVWGTPTKPVINSAGSGSKCWIVGSAGASFYNYAERSWVESPCFDLTAIDKPYVSFMVFWDSEYKYDGANLQYSLNNGATWITVGTSATQLECNEQNWYNHPDIINLRALGGSATGWSGNTQSTVGSCSGGHGLGTWVRASHCVPEVANQPQVIFRFAFGSGTTCNGYDGFAFDDFTLSSAPVAPIDFNFSCQGDSTITFTSVASTCLNKYSWNFDDPSSASNVSDNPNATHKFSAPGSYNVTFMSGGTCSGDTTITKQVIILDVNVSTTDVTCENDSDATATVTVVGGTTPSIQWNTLPVRSGFVITHLPVGNYTAVITDNVACGTTVEVSIVEGPGSRPRLDLGKDLRLCPGNTIPLSAHNFKSYLWQDGSIDSVYLITQSGKVTLNVLNSSGCKASDSLEVTEDCLNDILFPSAFTPNEDGINETFVGVGSEPFDFSLRIFNRWGEVVFESTDSHTGWDGKYKGHFVHDGVYLYQAQFTVADNEKIEKTGRLVLIR